MLISGKNFKLKYLKKEKDNRVRFFALFTGGMQKINLLHKAGGRVVSFGKRH
jgi:hypothetical protein